MIRRATVEDADTVGELLHRFNTEFASGEPVLPSAVDFRRRFRTLLARSDVIVLLAEDGPAPVGFAFATLRPTPYHDGPLAHLEELYVAPDRRSAGVGTLLLSELIRLVRALGGGEMHIGVDAPDTGARRFYERHGFSNLDPESGEPMLLYLREFEAEETDETEETGKTE